MNWRRASLTLSLAVSMLLAACAMPTPAPAPAGGGQQAEQPAVPPPEQPAPAQPQQQPTQITVWSRYDIDDPNSKEGMTLKQFFADLEREAGVKVIHEQVAWDQLATKLALAVQSGGDVPDIVEVSSQHIPALLNAGALTPLDDLLKGEAWVEDLTDGDRKACVRDGQRVCVATNVRGGMTYYKPKLMPDGFPKGPADWEKLCETLKPQGNFVNTFFAGRSYAAIEINWWPLIKSNGGSIFDAEGKPAWATEKVAEVARWAQRMFANECWPKVSVTGDFADSEVAWQEGKSAAFGGGSWSPIFVPGLLDQVNSGEVEVTGGTPFNGQPHVFMVSESWVVPKGAKNTQGALAFLRAFMKPAFLASWAEAQFGIPTTKQAYAEGRFKGSPFYSKVDKILGEQGAYMESSPYYVESLDILATTWQELMLNPDRDPLPELEKAANEVLQRYWK